MIKNRTNLLLGVIIILLGIIVFQEADQPDSPPVQKEDPAVPAKKEVNIFDPSFYEQVNLNKAEKNAGTQNAVPTAPDPDELTDQEIRNVRERIKRESGGEYYYYTPGRHVPSLEEIAEKKIKEGNWAEKNVRK